LAEERTTKTQRTQRVERRKVVTGKMSCEEEIKKMDRIAGFTLDFGQNEVT
jgi:hypothetical protein